MTAGVIRAQASPGVHGALHRRELAPVDPLLVRDLARVLVVTVLVVLALVTIVAAAAFLAGPVPVEGPAPGFAI